jgi:hypothetical protein
VSDTFGLLEVPLSTLEAETAVGDPLLDVVLSFVQAVVNAKTKAVWRAVCAYPTGGTSEPLPISFVLPHCPTTESFNTNTLPALYAWRLHPHAATTKYTQEWLIRESSISLLWVPPRATQEQARLREPFRNAVASVMAWAFERGRDPSWKVQDDTYYQAQTYGSTFRKQARLMWHVLKQVEPAPISIPYDDGPAEPYDALLGELLVREVIEWGDDAFSPADHIEGTFSTNGLLTVPFVFKVGVTAISPSSAAAAGGTTITLTGYQFQGAPTVTLGGAPCTNVTVVDNATITATTPAQSAGAPVDVVVTNPSGDADTLAAAFTFT